MESSNMNHSELSQPTLKIPYSLLGKNITVYRGGPESKTGRLMDVKQDYLVINSENKIIYYQAEHIKSITENSKTNSIQVNDNLEENPTLFQENTFKDLLTCFLNKKIQIDQGGPDSKQGILLEVGSDYLVLNTEDDGIVYYNLPHIKSIMGLEQSQDDVEENTVESISKWEKEENLKELWLSEENTEESSSKWLSEENTEESSSKWLNDENTEKESSSTLLQEESTENVMMLNILRGSNFQHLCSLMSHKWVSINRKGPEAVEGIFIDSSDGFYTLANNQELYRIHPFHVRSISIGPKGAMKQQQEENNPAEEQIDNAMDESTSEYNTVTSLSNGAQRNTVRTWGGRENRETSRNRETSSRRNTSRRRRSSSYWSNESRRTSRNRRTSRSRRTSSSKRTSSRRRTSSSSSSNRTRRNETVVRSVSFNWKRNS